MANMSVARGTLFLGSKSKDAVNTLITEVFTRTKDWHYSTTLGKGRTWYYDPAREHYAEYQFEGTGKWTFANNIEFLLSSAKKELEVDILFRPHLNPPTPANNSQTVLSMLMTPLIVTYF